MAKMVFLLMGCGLFVAVGWSFVRPLWRDGFRVLAGLVSLLASVLLVSLAYLLLA